MAHDFGDADIGKTVVSSEGRRIGSVDDVEEGRASIQFDPDAPGELAAALGADDTRTSTFR